MTTETETEEKAEVLVTFRAPPEIRKQVRIAAAKANTSPARWLKETVEQRLQQEHTQ